MKISSEDFKKGCNEFQWDGQTFHPPLTYNFNVHGGRVDDRDFIRTCLSFTAITILSEKFQDLILDSENIADSREVYAEIMSGELFYDLSEEFDTSAELSYGVHDSVLLDGKPLYNYLNRVYNRIETISKVVEKIVLNYLETYVELEKVYQEEIARSAKYISVALMTRNVENGDK
jgi:hypothetical protein